MFCCYEQADSWLPCVHLVVGSPLSLPCCLPEPRASSWKCARPWPTNTASASPSSRSRPLAFWEHVLPRLLAWHSGLAPEATGVDCGTSPCGSLRGHILSCQDSSCVFFSKLCSSLTVCPSENSLSVPLVGELTMGAAPSPSLPSGLLTLSGNGVSPARVPTRVPAPCSTSTSVPRRHPLQTGMTQGVLGVCGLNT